MWVKWWCARLVIVKRICRYGTYCSVVCILYDMGAVYIRRREYGSLSRWSLLYPLYPLKELFERRVRTPLMEWLVVDFVLFFLFDSPVFELRNLLVELLRERYNIYIFTIFTIASAQRKGFCNEEKTLIKRRNRLPLKGAFYWGHPACACPTRRWDPCVVAPSTCLWL